MKNRDTRILLVEDNENDELLTLRSLQKNKLSNEVVVARDGVEALSYLFDTEGDRYRNPLPQVILLDLKLPKVDGLEVLSKIRGSKRTKHLPVVVLTSSGEENDIIESYNLGVNSYIQKPVDFKDFANAVKQLGLYWIVLNKVPGDDRSSIYAN